VCARARARARARNYVCACVNISSEDMPRLVCAFVVGTVPLHKSHLCALTPAGMCV